MSEACDPANTFEGLVTEQSGERHLIWSKGLGYVQADLKGQGRCGDWVSIEFDPSSVRAVTSSTRSLYSKTTMEVNVLRCQRMPPPSPIFFHVESGLPCMNALGKKTPVGNKLHIDCLNLPLTVPHPMSDTLLEYVEEEYIVTLHFCDSDEPVPFILAISPFVVRKGVVTALNIEGSGSCEISVGSGIYKVEQHLVQFAEFKNRTHLKRGQRITVTISSLKDSPKVAIFQLHVMNSDGTELVYPANTHGVQIVFTISPINDILWDERRDCFYMSNEDIPVYVGCDLPNTSSRILVRASRVANSSGIFIWRISEHSALERPARCGALRDGHPSQVRQPYIYSPSYSERSSLLDHSSSNSERTAQIVSRVSQLSLHHSNLNEISTNQNSSRATTSSSKPQSTKKRITFNDDSQTTTYTYDDEQPKFSMKNFIFSEDESLRKPLINLRKNPTRSILKKPQPESNLIEQQGVINESTSDDSPPLVHDESSSTSPINEHEDDDYFAAKMATYLKDRDCGCNARWINYIKMVPRPEDIHSETIGYEPVFFFSRHTHNAGTRNEFEVWRGFTYNSFPGVIEIIPSTYQVPIHVNLGTWVSVSVLKIFTKRPPYLSGLMIKHTTVWKYYTLNEELKVKVQEQGHHQWLQILAHLSQNADSNKFFLAGYFGQVYIPVKLLDELGEFPADKLHYRIFSAWIEPLAKPMRMDGEIAYFQAITLNVESEQTLDDVLTQMVERSRVIIHNTDPICSRVPKTYRKAARKAKKERMKEEAKAGGQIYLPKEERLEDFLKFLQFLEQKKDDIPYEIIEDLVLPCQSVLDSDDKKKMKVRQVARIIATTFVLSEAGKTVIEGCQLEDPLVKWVVRILLQNLNFIKFSETEEDFEKACRCFLDRHDTYSSCSD